MKAHIIVSGFVQGVGFRHFVKNNAIKLGLTGWVTNLPDGRVEAVFQGSKENIEKMISICKKGPFLAEVEDVDIKWKEGKTAYDSFEIKV